MYCKNCGSHIEDEAKFCPHCGSKIADKESEDDYFASDAPIDDLNRLEDRNQAQRPAPNYAPVEDKGGFLWGLIGFFIPFVGLILFLVWKDQMPKRSKSCGIGALVGVIAYIVLVIVLYATMFALAATYASLPALTSIF